MPKRRPTGPCRPVALLAVLVATGAVTFTSGCARVGGERAATPAPTTAAHRALTLPETVLGLPRSKKPELTRVSRSSLERLRDQVTDATSTIEGAYARSARKADAVVVSGVSGTVTDLDGALARVLRPYPVKTFRTVEYGRYGGEARCGRGLTEDRRYLTVCGWADPETAGVVAFISAHRQLELNTEFFEIRDRLDGTTR
ncbi:hypothetical protein E1193_24325 [Micromonospora sp. KC606]|uniref:hypothetical protein n=1 Tax=Micromonospora sp. KC606 TaxID=2530379 RepID=UPI00104BEBD7|nr:hypothetical protein [Micromonospora sp. KC606]TDC76182.1 hypothetical protein E1193_24325 [Micromonospora sp. KC606]